MADFDHSSTPPRIDGAPQGDGAVRRPQAPAAPQIQHELAQERKAADANTARLRELRLAKEAADRRLRPRQTAAAQAKNPPQAGGRNLEEMGLPPPGLSATLGHARAMPVGIPDTSLDRSRRARGVD